MPKSERHILKGEMTTNCDCPECRAYRRKCRLRAKRAAKRETQRLAEQED